MKKIDNNLNVENLMKTKWHYHFVEDQEEQILLGLEENIDVSIYANSKFSASQMREIREGLEKGLNVSIYANPEYYWQQMENIRKQLENKK